MIGLFFLESQTHVHLGPHVLETGTTPIHTCLGIRVSPNAVYTNPLLGIPTPLENHPSPALMARPVGCDQAGNRISWKSKI